MGINIDPTHHRFYVYRVTNPGPDSVVKYRTSTGGWSDDLTDAMLWASQAFAINKAEDCAAQAAQTPSAYPSGIYMNVGRVTISLDSMYGLPSIEGVRCPTFNEPVMLKPSKGRQEQWLTMSLLHAAPSAEFVMVDGKHGAQLEHPKGGPLGWVESPYDNVTGVVRYKDAWHWIF